MARIEGVDLPRNKHIEISLTYIFGIGRTSARKICDKAGIEWNTKTERLSDGEESVALLEHGDPESPWRTRGPKGRQPESCSRSLI